MFCGVVWCGVVWCGVLCCAVLCCAVLCCAVLCCAVLCCAVLCCVLFRFVVLCYVYLMSLQLRLHSICATNEISFANSKDVSPNENESISTNFFATGKDFLFNPNFGDSPASSHIHITGGSGECREGYKPPPPTPMGCSEESKNSGQVAPPSLAKSWILPSIYLDHQCHRLAFPYSTRGFPCVLPRLRTHSVCRGL